MTPPRFETERLILRELKIEDAPNYQKKFNNYEIIGHLAPRVPWPYPEGGARDFIENIVIPRNGNKYWMWGIFLKTQPDEVIGSIDLFRSDAPDNRGFWLAQEHWGKGIIIEALKPITDYAFNELGFTELKLSNALGNLQSRRIKEKQGAKLIGVRDAKLVNPKYTQVEDWILTKEAWLKHRDRF